MKTLAFVLLSFAAGCTSGGDDDRPIVTNPGQPPATGGTGANVTRGRVCVGSDLRDLGNCSSIGAGGIAVSLGDNSTVTAADGTFTLPLPDTTLDEFIVSGTSTNGVSIVPTTSAFTTSATIPAIDAELYQSILLANGITSADGTGSVLVNVTRADLAASGVTVSSTPSGAGTLYAGSSSMVWNGTGTGESGTVLIPGITAGSVDLSYQTILGGLETQVNGVTVRNGGVTILSTQLPGSGTP